ncbi:MAG: hypothetical protein JW749_00995 [Sedimentisphaerales bacterium]|nr:hypothetical protein [Sedimentisphaerales bacterium]
MLFVGIAAAQGWRLRFAKSNLRKLAMRPAPENSTTNFGTITIDAFGLA